MLLKRLAIYTFLAVFLTILHAMTGTPPKVSAHHTPWDMSGTWVLLREGAELTGDHWLAYKGDGNVIDLKDHDEHLWLGCIRDYPTYTESVWNWNNCVSSFEMRLGADWCFRAYDKPAYVDPVFTLKAIGDPEWVTYRDMAGVGHEMWTSFRWAPFDYDTGKCLF